MIDSYKPEIMEAIEGNYKHPKVAMLGASIAAMADADYFIGFDGISFSGCAAETRVASDYGIPMFLLPHWAILTEEEVVKALEASAYIGKSFITEPRSRF